MPNVDWGIKSSDVDDFDRDSQFQLYTGKIPPYAVYQWRIKRLKFAAATEDKLPQLRVGLELVPRDGSEKKYSGYYLTAFLAIADNMAWKYVPFLDAIGVSGREFTNGTKVDQDNNVRKIGRWVNRGDEMIFAQLRAGEDAQGNERPEIGTFAPWEEPDESEDEFGPDDDYDEEIGEDDEDDEEDVDENGDPF